MTTIPAAILTDPLFVRTVKLVEDAIYLDTPMHLCGYEMTSYVCQPRFESIEEAVYSIYNDISDEALDRIERDLSGACREIRDSNAGDLDYVNGPAY